MVTCRRGAAAGPAAPRRPSPRRPAPRRAEQTLGAGQPLVAGQVLVVGRFRTAGFARAGRRGTGTGTRLNGSYFLTTDGPDRRVFDDGVKDHLTGGNGQDWFVANLDGDGDKDQKDKVTDLSAVEFADDLDFILGT